MRKTIKRHLKKIHHLIYHKRVNPDPSQQSVPIPESVIANNGFFYRQKKYLPLILTLIFVLILLSVVGYYLWQQKVKINSAKISPTPTPIPKEIITKTEVLPENLQKGPQVFNFDIFGKAKVRTNATIEKIITPESKYYVSLDTKEKATINITTKTMIGKAWVEIDQNGVVVRSSYNIIPKEQLANLKVGSRITVSYNKDDLINNQVAVEEFVLLN